MLRAFLFPVLLVLAGSDGSPRCPCLSAVSGLPASLGASFGIGCKSHELAAAQGASPGSELPAGIADCLNSSNTWCRDQWCFVDPQDCSLSGTTFRTWGNSSKSSNSINYATCGSLNSRGGASQFAGKKIKVVSVSSMPPWQYTLTCFPPQSIIQTDCRGVMYDYVASLLNEAGIDWEFDRLAIKGGLNVNVSGSLFDQFSPQIVPTANKVFASDSSAVLPNMTASYCMVAASLGYVDVCLVDLSITVPRIKVVDMISTYEFEYYLYAHTRYEVKKNIAKLFFTALRPFSWTLWLALIVVFVFFGLVMDWHEHHSYQDKDDPIRRYAEHEVQKDQRSPFRRLLDNLARIFFFLVDAPPQTMDGVQDSQPETPGGVVSMMAKLGLIFIVMTLYMGALVDGFVVQKEKVYSFRSVHDALLKGEKVCSPSTVQAEIVKEALRHSQELKQKPDWEAQILVTEKVWESAKTGACSAALASVQDFRNSLYKESGNSGCGFEAVGDPIARASGGIATSPRMASTMRHLVAKAELEGLWYRLLQPALIHRGCPEELPDTVIDSSPKPLTILETGVIWSLAGVLMLIGVFSTLCRCDAPRAGDEEQGRGYQLLQMSRTCFQAATEERPRST